jgi:hypothetical protein
LVTTLPTGWRYIADFGIRQMTAVPTAIAANVALGQDVLESEDALASYIKTQVKLIDGHLTEAKIAGPQAIAYAGADEACLLFVRHRPGAAGDMLHAQTYVRVGCWVGIITLTTLEAQLGVVRPDYDAFVRGLRVLTQEVK